MKEFFNPYRIMYGFGIIALCVALIMNITTVIPFVSFIPGVKWIEIAVNGFCLILCFVLFIFPHYKKLSYILFFLEGGMTTHIGFIGIGTLLFITGIIFCFINGDFILNRKRKLIILGIYWIIIVCGLYLSFGLKLFLFEIAVSFFYFALFACVYDRLSEKLSYLLLPTEVVAAKIELPPKGSSLKLSRYNLSERQQAFIIGSIKEGETYEVLAERYNVSISVVKKDMAAACKLFGVTNREALRILLLQYKW